MRIKLQSDFTDWYDNIFYPDGDVVWNRNRINQNPAEMFQFLARQAKMEVPVHGTVGEVAPTLIERMKRELDIQDEALITNAAAVTELNVAEAKKEAEMRQLDALARETQLAMFKDYTRLVVYLENETEMMDARDAMVQYPSAYCSQYIPSRIDGGSFTQTLYHIGEVAYIVEHTSSTWNSKYGPDVKMAVTNRVGVKPTFPIPSIFFSISFVPTSDKFVAIGMDLNPTLGLLQKYITAEELYALVEQYLERNNPN